MLSLTADTMGLPSKHRVSIPEYRSGQYTSGNSLKVSPFHIHSSDELYWWSPSRSQLDDVPPLLERWVANTRWKIHMSATSSKSFSGESCLHHSLLSFQLHAARLCCYWNVVSVVDLLGNTFKKLTKSCSHKVVPEIPEVISLAFLLAGKWRSQPWGRKGSNHHPSVVVAQPASCQAPCQPVKLCVPHAMEGFGSPVSSIHSSSATLRG